VGKNAKPSGATLPHPPINQVKPGLIHYRTLNLNILAFKQNITNLVGNFGAIHMGIMHAKFQLSSFNGCGRRRR